MKRRRFVRIVGGAAVASSLSLAFARSPARTGRSEPAVVDSSLSVSLDFGSGQVARFSGGSDMGDYVGEFVHQKCRLAVDPSFPDWRVFFRPDADGKRDEIVVEYGRTRHGTPANRLTPYTATISKRGSVLHSVIVPRHWWGARWRWQSSERPVVRVPDTLRKRGWIPNYGPDGLFGLPQFDNPIAWSGPMDAPLDRTGISNLFNPVMAAAGDHDQIGYLTQPAADYMIRPGASSLTTLRTEGEWLGNAAMHWRNDTTGAMLDARADYQGYVADGGALNDFPAKPAVGTERSYIRLEAAHMYPCATAPWLLTDDPFFLEELQFVCNWNLLFNRKPRINQRLAGLVFYGETRAYCWGLRDMLTAAATTPASVPSWLLPRSYFKACVDDCREFALRYVNSPAKLSTIFRTWTRTDYVASWQGAWLSTICGQAVTMGFGEWREIFDWSIAREIALTNGTSGWNRQWPVPYYYMANRNWANTPFSYYWTNNSQDATTCDSWADLWAYYKAGCGGGSDSGRGIKIDDTGWDGTTIMQTQAPYTYSSYYLHMRSALAQAVTLGVPGAGACYDWLHAQLTRLMPRLAAKGQAPWSVDPVAAAGNVIDPVAAAGNVIELVGTNTLSDVDPDPKRTSNYKGIMGQAGVLAYSGMAVAPDCGTRGSLIIHGGGDGDYWGNEVYAFDLARSAWTRLNDPSTAMNGLGENRDPAFDAAHSEFADGTVGSAHTYNHLAVVAGGTDGKGLLITVVNTWAYGHSVRGWAHACDLGATPPRWVRYSTNEYQPGGSTIQTPQATTYDATRKRIWLVQGTSMVNALGYLDLANRTYVTLRTSTTRQVGANVCATQFPVRDLMVFGSWVGAYQAINSFILQAVDLGNPANGIVPLTLTGDAIPRSVGPCAALDWDVDNNVGYLLLVNSGEQSDMNHVYEIAPPAADLLTSPWRVRRITTPTPFLPNASAGIYSRWRYCAALKKFAMVSKTTDRVTLWTPPLPATPLQRAEAHRALAG